MNTVVYEYKSILATVVASYVIVAGQQRRLLVLVLKARSEMRQFQKEDPMFEVIICFTSHLLKF